MPAGRERIVICCDCGAEVKTRYSRTLRCKECAVKHNREQSRETRAKKRAENRKGRKFQTKYEKPDNDQFCDTPENIQKCLNCTKPKCGNCLASKYTKKTDRKYERKKESA